MEQSIDVLLNETTVLENPKREKKQQNFSLNDVLFLSQRLSSMTAAQNVINQSDIELNAKPPAPQPMITSSSVLHLTLDELIQDINQPIVRESIVDKADDQIDFDDIDEDDDDDQFGLEGLI